MKKTVIKCELKLTSHTIKVCTAARLARDISSVEEKQSDELRDNFFSTLNEDQKTILNRLIYNIKSAKSLAGKTFGVVRYNVAYNLKQNFKNAKIFTLE